MQPVLEDIVCIRTVVSSYTGPLLHDNKARSIRGLSDITEEMHGGAVVRALSRFLCKIAV